MMTGVVVGSGGGAGSLTVGCLSGVGWMEIIISADQ